jgi:hypothetical protein
LLSGAKNVLFKANWARARRARRRSWGQGGVRANWGGRGDAETLPNIPTFAEAGLPLPEINAGGWLGILAPAGTLPDIVRKLNGAFNAALRDPGVRGELEAMGFIPEP